MAKLKKLNKEDLIKQLTEYKGLGADIEFSSENSIPELEYLLGQAKEQLENPGGTVVVVEAVNPNDEENLPEVEQDSPAEIRQEQVVEDKRGTVTLYAGMQKYLTDVYEAMDKLEKETYLHHKAFSRKVRQFKFQINIQRKYFKG